MQIVQYNPGILYKRKLKKLCFWQPRGCGKTMFVLEQFILDQNKPLRLLIYLLTLSVSQLGLFLNCIEKHSTGFNNWPFIHSHTSLWDHTWSHVTPVCAALTWSLIARLWQPRPFIYVAVLLVLFVWISSFVIHQALKQIYFVKCTHSASIQLFFYKCLQNHELKFKYKNLSNVFLFPSPREMYSKISSETQQI